MANVTYSEMMELLEKQFNVTNMSLQQEAVEAIYWFCEHREREVKNEGRFSAALFKARDVLIRENLDLGYDSRKWLIGLKDGTVINEMYKILEKEF